MRRVYTLAAILTGLAAMSLSWWSIYELGTGPSQRGGLAIPAILAAGLSSVFDLAALVMVGLCERYAASPTAGSGAGPRSALVLMLAGSVFLNVRHAQMTGVGVTGAIAYSAPAVVAVLLVELHLRFSNHLTRHQLGRVAPSLPVLGAWAVLLYPGRALGVVRMVVRARLDAIADTVKVPTVHASAELVTPHRTVVARTVVPRPPAPPASAPPAPAPAPAQPPAPNTAPATPGVPVDPFAAARADTVRHGGTVTLDD